MRSIGGWQRQKLPLSLSCSAATGDNAFTRQIFDGSKCAAFARRILPSDFGHSAAVIPLSLILNSHVDAGKNAPRSCCYERAIVSNIKITFDCITASAGISEIILFSTRGESERILTCNT